MLPNPTTAARPRPPAQMRRSGSAPMAMSSKSSVSASPPPPYAGHRNLRKPPMETLLGSPISATYQVVGWENESAESEDWLNEKSREELSELLLKANGIIKNREDELDRTSVIFKTLYEDKVALQNKHQELLSRIPLGSPSRAHSASPSPSQTPLSLTPSHSISGLSHSVSDSFPRRIRKISVSPQDISLLADQNAELHLKLEKLEAESSDAEASGRRMLKKLEKEISLLRDELEKTQGELERTQVANSGWDPEKVAEEMAKKKMERESRFKALRAGSSTSDPSDDSIRDFAPGGPLSNIPSTVSHPIRTEPVQNASETSPIDQGPISDPESSGDSWKTPPRRSRQNSTDGYTLSEPQLALISQLLMKIQELEDTNANIIEQQKQTSSKLQAVQRETENISKVYECLSDLNGVKLELVEDSSFASETGDDGARLGDSDGENTIRFRSLRRTIESYDLLKMMGGDVSESDISPLNLAASSIRKPRKSVMNLFESSPEPSPTPKERASNIPVLFPSVYDSCYSENFSPSLSSLNLARSASESPMPSLRGQNLRSELGSEYGDDWSLNAPNHHLRTSSLYNLSQLQSTSPTPSRRSSLLASGTEEVPHGLKTPVFNVLQLTLEPPTPPSQFDAGNSSTSDSGSLRSNQTAKQRRLSQTIRARTNRWVDGWLMDSIRGDSSEVGRPSVTNIEKVFNEGVDKVVGSQDASSDTVCEDAGKELAMVKVERQGLSKLILELWLWLQFVIIVVVFLFAMAKRGPRAILGDTEQRSAVARRH